MGPVGPVHSGTAPFRAAPYPFSMQLESIKAAVATAWALGVCAAGVAGNSRSPSSWTILAGIAVLPPLVMMWGWNSPRQTMSETIREALR